MQILDRSLADIAQARRGSFYRAQRAGLLEPSRAKNLQLSPSTMPGAPRYLLPYQVAGWVWGSGGAGCDRWVSVKSRGGPQRNKQSRRVLRVFGDQLEKTAGHSSPEIQGLRFTPEHQGTLNL